MRVVRGAGVMLEPQVAGHAAELFAILSDPALYAYLDEAPPADEATLRTRLARLESRLSGDGSEDWLNWIVRRPDGTMVGYVQATVYRDGRADVAYVIGSAHWRRGYAAAATETMLGELAAAYGVTLAQTIVDPANAASIGLLRKLGFEQISDDTALPDIAFMKDLAS
ncbi:MAG: GNAT family N-acetyltransferase [Devosia nanyangense]|uniref:GNAT family N-acetyltransferase n=1 Tax=Devosia nanyangense TaxID=1228055 RepID=A0A933L454_9HYPH|nr:GNAT family N-acetyltransferase [Devosia nanyangense]